MNAPFPEWLTSGQGLAPQPRWSYSTDAPLATLCLARESGDIVAGDDTGAVVRLDRRGRLTAITRGFHPICEMAISDDGQNAVLVVNQDELHWITKDLKVKWSLNLQTPILAVALDPFGHHAAVCLENNKTYIYTSRKKRIAEIESVRPLRFLQFTAAKPAFIAAAEYGLLCQYTLQGREIWNEKLWSHVGNLCITGDGETILLAGFNHGIQVFESDGAARGSYVVEGTPQRVSASYAPRRVVAATLEQHLYWLDSDGELLWASSAPEEITHVHCDPLGNWVICGLASGPIYRLDWK